MIAVNNNNQLSPFVYYIIKQEARELLLSVQWNLYNPTPEFSDILWRPTKIYCPKVFLLTKIEREYSNILFNQTHFPGPLVCLITGSTIYSYTKYARGLPLSVYSYHGYTKEIRKAILLIGDNWAWTWKTSIFCTSLYIS